MKETMTENKFTILFMHWHIIVITFPRIFFIYSGENIIRNDLNSMAFRCVISLVSSKRK